jgi:hypothetical protein
MFWSNQQLHEGLQQVGGILPETVLVWCCVCHAQGCLAKALREERGSSTPSLLGSIGSIGGLAPVHTDSFRVSVLALFSWPAVVLEKAAEHTQPYSPAVAQEVFIIPADDIVGFSEVNPKANPKGTQKGTQQETAYPIHVLSVHRGQALCVTKSGI